MYNSDKILFKRMYQFNAWDLYSRISKPHELYDGRIVHMTTLEADVFLKPEYRTSFYEHDDIWEPLLIDEDFKKEIVGKMVRSLPVIKDDLDKIHCLHFQNGDRDLVSLAFGKHLKYDVYKMRDLDFFKQNEELYNIIQTHYNDKKSNEKLFYIIEYAHNTEEILTQFFLKSAISSD